jgi:hypothetical protein
MAEKNKDVQLTLDNFPISQGTHLLRTISPRKYHQEYHYLLKKIRQNKYNEEPDWSFLEPWDDSKIIGADLGCDHNYENSIEMEKHVDNIVGQFNAGCLRGGF